MAYGWAHLVFVERWRLSSVQGLLVGMWRVGETTRFHLSPQPIEGTSSGGGLPDLDLLDVGNLIKEKRLSLYDRVSVIVHPIAVSVEKTDLHERHFAARSQPPSGRKVLDVASPAVGQVLESDGERNVLVHIGLPVVVGIQNPEVSTSLQVGDWLKFTAESPVQGFILAR